MGSLGNWFGPSFDGKSTVLNVFAPERERVELVLGEDLIPMSKSAGGFWQAILDEDSSRAEYGYLVNGEGPFPDPAVRFMPEGIDGPSQITNPNKYDWRVDDWRGKDLSKYIIEEVHTGTFTREGTYAGIEKKLDFLAEVGITAIELMPLAQFYGSRNWGYDGVYIYSPHYAYGTPEDLMHLIDSMHERGICAILDVVYNHSGHVGNYLEKFAPYYNNGYGNTWGKGFNLDGEYSNVIREFLLQNATYWLQEFRFDALRLDAVHAIVDHSPVHILKEMSERVAVLSKKSDRDIYLIAESDSNDSKLTSPVAKCGMGIDAQWDDDFHHCLHTYLTGEREGYYADYGGFDQIIDVLRQGFLYQGDYSKYLRRNRGTRWTGTPEKLVVCSQNHDQIGNRAFGERLVSIAGDNKAKLAAAFTILSPFTPLIFMGEEIGAVTPFLFFIDSPDPAFAKKVYRGRMEEFKKFNWNRNPPDPNSLETFISSGLDWRSMATERTENFLRFYKDLIMLRKSRLTEIKHDYRVESPSTGIIKIIYREELEIIGSFSDHDQEFHYDSNQWKIILRSDFRKYGGPIDENEPHCNVLPLTGYSVIVREKLA